MIEQFIPSFILLGVNTIVTFMVVPIVTYCVGHDFIHKRKVMVFFSLVNVIFWSILILITTMTIGIGPVMDQINGKLSLYDKSLYRLSG